MAKAYLRDRFSPSNTILRFSQSPEDPGKRYAEAELTNKALFSRLLGVDVGGSVRMYGGGREFSARGDGSVQCRSSTLR